jgi:hypothetical protein
MRQQLLWLFLPIVSLAQVTIDGDVVRKSTGEPVPGVPVAARCGSFFTATEPAGWAATIDAARLPSPSAHTIRDCAFFLVQPRLYLAAMREMLYSG